MVRKGKLTIFVTGVPRMKEIYVVPAVRVVALVSDDFVCLSGAVGINPGFDGEIDIPLD